MTSIKNVTNTDCNTRHKRIWCGISLLGVVLGLLATVVGWSWARTVDAVDAASAAQSAAKNTQTEMKTSFSFVREGLKEIKTEQAAQRAILADLAREHGGGE